MSKPKNKQEELLIFLKSLNNKDSDSDPNIVNNNLKKLCIQLLTERLNSLMLISHSRKGDNAEFIVKNDKYYTKSIDDLLTLYYSKETDKYVGGLIKGVSIYLKKLDQQHIKGFIVEIDDGSSIGGHVFLVDKKVDYKYEELEKHIYRI